ncbi:HNH endonuclease signature motif containing protein [Candidatus Mycobacterium wuenschmannii]|uniref:HNH endonuclease signature motif containing protein n=1 Tax=Candidatus Mycobacterium wuenschmannii TaxID=3027808 RepID=A0ABY8VSS5_9MYCO|nr:HNH endonuclease signature motif containing protein [Candidatus Mycobacterium wuenschmannii]WIM86683.1 HNH endonuclease signature motif containing protein [Candidatus Mycobacterium wuenschmannii]
MSSIGCVDASAVSRAERLEMLFEELAELSGQRNAIDGRVVEIVAEIDHDGLWGATGARSVRALVAWKTGCSLANAHTVSTIASRLPEFPRCAEGMREGRLSLDQVGVIAARAGEGSDAHYAQLASVATVAQLRTAVSLEPRPDPDPRPKPERSITTTRTEHGSRYRITLDHHDAAKFDAALASHLDALIAEWKHDHGGGAGDPDQRPPLPNTAEAFMRLIEAGWDTETARRPHGQHTTAVVHVDVEQRAAALHLGPLLTDAERRYLTCDATCEVWFERRGEVIGAGRTTRTVNRRLRRALEHRDRTCAVPGCEATRGLHAHHIQHWEDGGPTELANLVLLCPYHHRLHHRGVITITGPASNLTVTDNQGHALSPASLARPPTQPPPDVPPCPGPLGERADWWWYDPFQPQPPPSTN